MNPSHDKEYGDAYHWGNDDDGDNSDIIRKGEKNYKNKYYKPSSASADPLALIVLGKVSTIHRNDVVARSLHQEKHLINYCEDRFPIDNKGDTQHSSNNVYDDEKEDTWCDIVHYDGSHFDGLPPDPNSIAQSCRATAAVQLTKSTPEQFLLDQDSTDALTLDQNSINHSRRRRTNAMQSAKSAAAPQQLLVDRYDARNLLDDYHTIDHTINNNDSLTRLDMYLHDQKNGGTSQDQEVDLNLERYGCLKEYWPVFCDSPEDTEYPTSTMTGTLCLERKNEETIIEKQSDFTTAADTNTNTEDGEFDMMEQHEKKLLPIVMILVRI